jgi:hypothetical protein
MPPKKFAPVPSPAVEAVVQGPDVTPTPSPSVTVRTDGNGQKQTITRPHEGAAFVVEWL